MAPGHPEHSDNPPEHRGQPQASARKALGRRPPHGVPGTRAYFIYVLAFPSGKTYGCFFRKTCPTRLQGTISRLPPHIHTRKEISARQPRPPSPLCLPGRRGHRMAALRYQVPGNTQVRERAEDGLRLASGAGLRAERAARLCA